MGKIKILHISPDFNYSCGVSKYVFSLLKSFSDNNSYELYFITNKGDALDKLKEIKIKPHILRFKRGMKNVLYFLLNIKALIDYCLKYKIDIIHTHHRYPELLAFVASKFINIKTITTAHSIFSDKTFFSFRSQKIIAVSNSVMSMLINNFNVPVEKIVKINNFIEPIIEKDHETKLKIKSDLGIPQNAKIILYVGRITKIKGVDTLIESFKLILNKYNDIYLLIVGSIYDKSLKNILNNIPSQIKLLCPVNDPSSFYSISDIFVLPSRVDPFPYVMLEAGLNKIPFVGSRTGGIEEFIDDNLTGLLIEPGCYKQLTQKISYLLENPVRGKLLAEKLFVKVKQNISSEIYLDNLTKIYKQMLK